MLYQLLEQSLSNGASPAEVGQKALALVIQNLSILRGEIFYGAPDGRLALLALAGYEDLPLSDLQPRVEERLRQALFEQVRTSGRAVIIPDIHCQETWLPLPELDETICSAAVLPLVIGRDNRKILGVMNLLSDQTGYFTDEQLPLLMAVANVVALTLHNANLFTGLITSQEQLRQLAAELITTQEQERQRVSRTLHDEAGQALVTLRLSLNAIRRELLPNGQAAQKVEEADQLLDEVMGRIRQLAYDLRPPELDTIGLDAALAALCRDYSQSESCAVIYHGFPELPPPPERVAITLYRCLQEALTNVSRHAAASVVSVRLTVDNKGWLKLQVKDNGRGFPQPVTGRGPLPAGFGLLGMRERLQREGGRLELVSAPDTGTRLTAAIPLASHPEAEKPAEGGGLAGRNQSGPQETGND